MVFRKTDVLRPATLLEDSVAGVSYEICKIFQSNYTMQYTSQKMEFSIKDFFSKCILHLHKKSLMKNLIFCAVIERPPENEDFCWFTHKTI